MKRVQANAAAEELVCLSSTLSPLPFLLDSVAEANYARSPHESCSGTSNTAHWRNKSTQI